MQDNKFNTEFDALQLRVLGADAVHPELVLPISTGWRRRPRVVFALFQVPLARTGTTSTSTAAAARSRSSSSARCTSGCSTDPAYYVLQRLRAGQRRGVEFGGPMDKKGKFLFRAFLGGGSGRFAGNIGGTFFPDNNNNYTLRSGGQFWMNFVGYYSRWDTPFLYTPVAADGRARGRCEVRSARAGALSRDQRAVHLPLAPAAVLGRELLQARAGVPELPDRVQHPGSGPAW